MGLILLSGIGAVVCYHILKEDEQPKTEPTEQKPAADKHVEQSLTQPVEVEWDSQQIEELPFGTTQDKPEQAAKKKQASATKKQPTKATDEATTSCEDGEESLVYWEELRKHSPNDNYLIGFDEDVDDVHDMEIYIEDYQ